MERAITGFHRDEEDVWVAELACGHNQHVRHRPPFQLRPWVVTAEGRDGRLGSPLDCPWCDRAEPPDSLRWVRATPGWDATTMPAGLRRAHQLGPGTWGKLVVETGGIRFRAATTPPLEVDLRAGDSQAIPPEVRHEVAPSPDVRFHLEFFAVDRRAAG